MPKIFILLTMFVVSTHTLSVIVRMDASIWKSSLFIPRWVGKEKQPRIKFVAQTHASWIVTSCVHSLGLLFFFSMTFFSSIVFREASFSIKIELDSIYLQCGCSSPSVLLFIMCIDAIESDPSSSTASYSLDMNSLFVFWLSFWWIWFWSHHISIYPYKRSNVIVFVTLLGHTWLLPTTLGIYLGIQCRRIYRRRIKVYSNIFTLLSNYPSPPSKERERAKK